MMAKFKEIKTSQSLIGMRKRSDRTGGKERDMMTDYYKSPK